MISPLSAANAYQAAARIAGGGAPTPGAARGRAATRRRPISAPCVKNALADATHTIHAGEVAAAQGAAGQADIVNVVNAVNAAELTLETVVAVRDKVIAAYQDILKMPI